MIRGIESESKVFCSAAFLRKEILKYLPGRITPVVLSCPWSFDSHRIGFRTCVRARGASHRLLDICGDRVSRSDVKPNTAFLSEDRR